MRAGDEAHEAQRSWKMELDPARQDELWYRNKVLCREEYEDGRILLEARPAWISLDPGSVCNLRCVQCPREHPGNNFVENKADQQVADRVLGFSPYLERLSLYGLGEPLLSRVFWSIIEHANTNQIPNIDINSNGTLLTEKNVDRLLRSNLTVLRVSIDAATSETYRKIRGGNLEKVIAGVRRLTRRRQELSRGDFQVWLSMTLMLENIRELPMMVDLACEVSADALWAQHLVMKSDKSQDNWRITHKDWTFVYNEQHLSNAPSLSNEMVRQAKEKAQQRGFNFELDPELWLPEPNGPSTTMLPVPSSTAVTERRPPHRPVRDCHQPWESLIVGPLGHVQPCCFASGSVGNLSDESIEEVWNGPAMVRLRRSIRDGYIDRTCRNAGCTFVRDTERAFGMDAYDFRCDLDTEISLCAGAQTDHCVSGWYPPEPWGVWSEGETALLVLDVPKRPVGDLQLFVLCRGAGYEHRRTIVRVEVNDRETDCWHFCYPDSTEQSAWRTIDIPAETMAGNRIQVRFRIEAPVSPKLWGIDDGRLLGIAVSAMKLRCAPDFKCELDREISLCEGRSDHCYFGWHPAEHWGVWSAGRLAALLLVLPEKPVNDLQLDILCRGAGNEHFRPVVRVEVNGREMHCWYFYYPDSIEQSIWRTVDVPTELMTNNRVEVRFCIETPFSPKLWGTDDGRLLGVAVSALTVRHVRERGAAEI
jgi:MoaA/NifB/PqqE/SkfB family radical SAM enzyme